MSEARWNGGFPSYGSPVPARTKNGGGEFDPPQDTFALIAMVSQKDRSYLPRRAAARGSGRQRVLRVAAVERKPAARHHAADLVVDHVADLAAELEGMFGHRPRQVVDELKRLVVVDEGRVAFFTEP